MADLVRLQEAMGELEEEEVLAIAKEVMAEGGQDGGKALEACQAGMDTVGKLFEEGDYFVGDLIFAGELMTKVVEILKPALTGDEAQGAGVGRMILCTVAGDLHDIGKNIVKAMLEAAGIEVLDLGIDVPPEDIVNKAKEEDIRVIGLSGVLTLALDSMRNTVEAFARAGMRDEVKIVVGGACVTSAALERTGADEWAINPQKTVAACKEWMA